MSKHKKLNPNCIVCDNEGYITTSSPIKKGVIKVPHLCLPNLKSIWEEEFEDKIYQAGESYGGVYLEQYNFEDLVLKYLNATEANMSDFKGQKVKIKARKGKILIERID